MQSPRVEPAVAGLRPHIPCTGWADFGRWELASRQGGLINASRSSTSRLTGLWQVAEQSYQAHLLVTRAA